MCLSLCGDRLEQNKFEVEPNTEVAKCKSVRLCTRGSGASSDLAYYDLCVATFLAYVVLVAYLLLFWDRRRRQLRIWRRSRMLRRRSRPGRMFRSLLLRQ